MKKNKFLIIDDDKFYRTYVADLLSDLDVEIVSAKDGEAGLELSLSEKPDLIITDIEIPKIQGFTLLKMIRERSETGEIPVILMSGKVERDLLDHHSRSRERADGYLIKPFSGQALLGLIDKVLGASAEDKTPNEKGGGTDPGEETGHQTRDHVSVNEGPKGPSRSDRPPKALVVDDSRYICDIAQDFLAEIGFYVETAMDGEEGARKARDFLPDLVLLDVQMPKMNGFTVCEMLRKGETTKNAVIILMSAVVDSETFERHSKLKYHADDYIQKPFMKSELQDLVRGLFKGQGTGRTNLEAKTGFMVPSEEETVSGTEALPMSESDISKRMKEFEETKSSLKSRDERCRELERELKEVSSERDRLEDEVYDLRSHKGDEEKVLQDRLILLTQRFEESQSLIDHLEKQNQKLQKIESEKAGTASGVVQISADRERELERKCERLGMDLAAAVSAKREIEDQVQYLREKQGAGGTDVATDEKLKELNERNSDLIRRAETAESRLNSLSGVESQLKKVREEVEILKGKLEEGRTLFSVELGKKEERIRGLEAELGEVKKVKNQSEKDRQRLISEQDLRTRAEVELGSLKERIGEFSGIENRYRELERKNAEIKSALEKSDRLRAELANRLKELSVTDSRETNPDETRTLNERLDKLEAALRSTVSEAQSVIDRQSAKELQLQENMNSLMSSLQEDREAFQEERDRWKKREEDLRGAFEDALEENRRIMGEETARLYPMLLPKKTRTIEVVKGPKRYALAGAIILLLAAVLVLSYLHFSRTDSETQTGNVLDRIGRPDEAAKAEAPLLSPTLIPPSAKGETYAEIWRRQTVQSVSDDLMVQATLHTPKELESAIMYSASKEGWTGQRRDNVISDMMGTFKFGDYFYVTIFSKDLHEGYTGYFADFEKHIALRDDTGRETKALLPRELEGNRFITSRISAAEREMNPDFMYDVGLTVSFNKNELTRDPDELKVVIYDVGGIPMRILTWELSAGGS